MHINDLAAWYNISFGSSNANPLYYANNLYLNGELVTDLTIPNSITSIGNYAFYGCTGLKSITIPKSITSIGNYAFYGCTGLKSVEFNAENCTYMGSSSYPVFRGCNALSTVTIGENVKNIPSYAFYGCTGLTSITIPNSVTSIGESAFYGCTRLTSVVIGNSVTSIGDLAFEGCDWLTSVVVDDNNTKYDSRENCNAIIDTETNTLISGCKNTVIPNSVTSIGQSAFRGCIGLTSIKIPNSVKSIGHDAFLRCNNLTNIELPSSLTTIEQGVFSRTGLTTVTIPEGVTSLGIWAFDNCPALVKVNLPKTLTSIGDYAFEGCTGLRSIEIPNSVTSIGNYAFRDCSGLETVINLSNLTFSKGSSDYGYVAYYATKVINAPNAVIDGDFIWCKLNGTNTLACYLGEVAELTLPADYNGENYVIGNDAFMGCTRLTSITIPNSVTSIGSSAFSGCRNLTNVKFDFKVETEEKELYRVKMSSGYLNIGSYQESSGAISGANIVGYTDDNDQIFTIEKTNDGNYYLKSLSGYYIYCHQWHVDGHSSSKTALTFEETVNGEFYIKHTGGYFKVEEVDGVNYPFCDAPITAAATWTLEKAGTQIVSIGKSIESSAFAGCFSLTSITIPSNVTKIGNQAFENCTGLKTVINFSNLTFSKGSSSNGYIAYYADKVYNAPSGSIEGDFIFGKPNDVNTLLYYLGNATELTLPADYNGENYVIDSAVFKDNTVITSVTIPNSVTSVGDDAFTGCTNVEKLSLDCAEVGDWFSGISALKEVTIGSGVTSVVASAFYGCTGLEKVCINDLVAWCGIDFGSADANPLYYAGNLYLNGKLLTDIPIPAEVEKVKDYAFYNCNGVTNIDIVDKIKSIGNSAFYGCSDLETIYISNTIESIGNYAFAECNNILDIKIGSKKAIAASENIFSSDAYNNACLYVPTGRQFAYEKATPWNNFYIVEIDFTGIDEVLDEVKGEDGKVKTIYDLRGRAVENQTNGIYIIDGKKVFVK